MTINNRMQKVVMALVMLLISANALIAQNLIVNGDFEQTTGFNYDAISDYQRIYGGGVESGQFIHDVTSTDHGSGMLGGWPSGLTGYGGSGYYLLFNGFGGSENPTKAAWRQNVDVTSQTSYTFSCQLRNLSQSFFGVNPNPAVIRIKINGETVGDDVTFNINNHDWQQVTRTWNSGNVSGTITIEIFDVFTGVADSGDDFGLDALSFIGQTYSVTVNPDEMNACLSRPVVCDVLGNDVILPDEEGMSLSILTPPVHGQATILGDNTIKYVYDDSDYYGSDDQFQYRVTSHGVSGDAWVQVTVYNTSPINEGQITACEPIYHHDTVCDQNGLYVVDSITPNGCHIQISWHFTLGEEYVAFPETPVVCDSFYWDRNGRTYYEDVFEYDTVYSENSQICDSIFILDLTVNHAPTIQGSIQLQDICAGELLEVTEPEYAYNHIEGGYHQWEFANTPDGTFQAFFPETSHFAYGSHYVRFAVGNGCDTVYSNVVPVHINGRPIINGQLTPLFVCEDNPLDLPEVSVDWRNASQEGVSEWQMADSQDGQYAAFDTSALMQMEQNNHWLRFMARNECDSAFLGPVKITVLNGQDVVIEHGPRCDSVLYDGVYYKESTTIQELVEEPCPHVINHQIIVNHSEYTMEPIAQVTCHDEFEWHDQTYHRSDGLEQLMRWETVTEHGCNKVVEQQLIFDNYSTKTEDRLGCDSYYWPRNDSSYDFDENQVYPFIQDSVFLPGEGEVCDSIIYLNLYLSKGYENEFDTLACEPFEWYGFVCNDYSTTMTIFHKFETDQGCDSTVIKHVTLNKVDISTQFMQRCDSYLCPYDGVLYDEPNVYYINIDTVYNEHQCISTIQRICLVIKDSGQMGLIHGNANVLVASNLISGIYRYEINPDEVLGDISWRLSDPAWQIVEAQQNYCLVYAATPGTVTLSANFRMPECGEIERSFEITAGFFDVGDHDAIAANIYPNPTNGFLTVEAEGIQSLRLTNMTGQTLDFHEYDRHDAVILDLDGFAPSVYLLEIKTVNGVIKKQVIVSW